MSEFNKKYVGFAFAYFAWAHYCLLQKERDLPDFKEIPSSIYYPLVLLSLTGLLDNVRLVFGLAYSKDGASLFLAKVSHFAQYVIVPCLVGTFSSLFTALTGWSWIGTLGHIATVPLVANGLNVFLTEVLDYLVYTDKDMIPRYTLEKAQTDVVVDQKLPATLYIVLCNALIVSVIALFATGDIVPLLLQVAVYAGQTALPSLSPSLRIPVSNGLELLCLAGIMRLQRYL